MESGVKGNKALIAVVSCPGKTLGSRTVRWRLGVRTAEGKIVANKQGSVTVDIPNHFAGSNAGDQVAELAALHHLLVVHEVLGQARGGKNLIIHVSHGAIRKFALWFKQVANLPMNVRKAALKIGEKSIGFDEAIMNGESSKSNVPIFAGGFLVPYGRFLFGRFADAELVVNKDIKWISPVLTPKMETSMVLGKMLPDIVYASETLGYVEITTHAVERFAGRGVDVNYQTAWRNIVNQLTSNALRHVDQKYADTYRLSDSYVDKNCWHNPIGSWIFVMVKDGNYYQLVTVYGAKGK